MSGFELILAIPALLVTIYGVNAHGLPRHPRAAIATLILLSSVLLLDVAMLAFHLSQLPLSD